MNDELTPAERALIAEIGKANFYFEGPETDKAERKEFRQISVYSLRRAVERGFIAGRASALNAQEVQK